MAFKASRWPWWWVDASLCISVRMQNGECWQHAVTLPFSGNRGLSLHLSGLRQVKVGGAFVVMCLINAHLWFHLLKMITKMISRSTTILLSGGSTLVPFLCFTSDGRRTYMARIDVFQTFRLDMVVFFSWFWKNGHWPCILQVFAIFLHIKIIQRQINSNKIQIKFKNSINSKMIINR